MIDAGSCFSKSFTPDNFVESVIKQKRKDYLGIWQKFCKIRKFGATFEGLIYFSVKTVSQSNPNKVGAFVNYLVNVKILFVKGQLLDGQDSSVREITNILIFSVILRMIR